MQSHRPGAKRTLLLATLVLLMATTVLPPASPATEDSARLIVTAEEKLLTDHASFTWDETVDLALLPPGATGLDLLDHVATILGSSYEVTWHEDAAFVDEVNGVATDFSLILIGYFWALLEDGAYSDHAINEITLAPGTTLELQYEGWPLDI